MISTWRFVLRVFLVGIAAMLINLLLDRLLKVEIGSGRDNFLFMVLLGLGYYFFIWKWLQKQRKLHNDQ